MSSKCGNPYEPRLLVISKSALAIASLGKILWAESANNVSDHILSSNTKDTQNKFALKEISSWSPLGTLHQILGENMGLLQLRLSTKYIKLNQNTVVKIQMVPAEPTGRGKMA